jgi:hypothetical protein
MAPPRAFAEAMTSDDRRRRRPRPPVQAGDSSQAHTRRCRHDASPVLTSAGRPLRERGHQVEVRGEPLTSARLGHALPRRRPPGDRRGPWAGRTSFHAATSGDGCTPCQSLWLSDGSLLRGQSASRPTGPCRPCCGGSGCDATRRLVEQLSLRSRQCLGCLPVARSVLGTRTASGLPRGRPFGRGSGLRLPPDDDLTFEALLRRQAFGSSGAFPRRTIHVLPWVWFPFEAFRPSPPCALSSIHPPSLLWEASFPEWWQSAARADLHRSGLSGWVVGVFRLASARVTLPARRAGLAFLHGVLDVKERAAFCVAAGPPGRSRRASRRCSPWSRFG